MAYNSFIIIIQWPSTTTLVGDGESIFTLKFPTGVHKFLRCCWLMKHLLRKLEILHCCGTCFKLFPYLFLADYRQLPQLSIVVVTLLASSSSSIFEIVVVSKQHRSSSLYTLTTECLWRQLRVYRAENNMYVQISSLPDWLRIERVPLGWSDGNIITDDASWTKRRQHQQLVGLINRRNVKEWRMDG